MATSVEFIEYVVSKIKYCGEVRYRKMFGEYMAYVDDKPVLLVCDDTVFVKMLPEIKELLKDAETGFPYDGAKEHYIIDPDDENFNAVVGKLAELSEVKKRGKNGKLN